MGRNLVRLLALCAAGSLVATPARASEPLRVVVRVASESDEAIVPRIRGQLSDVPSALTVVSAAPLEAAFSDQVARAHALSREHDAEVVLWFSARGAEGSEILVHVATPRSERIFTRRLAAEGNAQSGLYEAAALVVRSAVSALSAGGAIGVATAEAVAEEQRAAASAPSEVARPPLTAASAKPEERTEQDTREPVAQAEPNAEPAAHASSPQADPESEAEVGADFPLHASLFAGVQSVRDGESKSGQHGGRARLGVMLGALELHAFAALGAAATIDDPWVTLQVARHDVGGVLAYGVTPGAALRVSFGASAGAVLFSRSGRPKNAQVRTTAANTTAAFVFGPSVLLSWHPSALGVALELDLDVMPNAPAFAVTQMASGSTLSHALDHVQPRASLGVEVLLP